MEGLRPTLQRCRQGVQTTSMRIEKYSLFLYLRERGRGGEFVSGFMFLTGIERPVTFQLSVLVSASSV